MNAPLPPRPSLGCTPRIGIYLPHNTTSLSSSNINVISNPGPLLPPVENATAVRAVMRGIRNGGSATIVFLGDSITAQNDVQGGSFVDRFADHLRQRFHSHRVIVTSPATAVALRAKEVVIVKAGVGGNNSSQGLVRFESDVAHHRPQIVVIMFGANDENRQPGGRTEVSLAQYRRNLETMIRQARQAGAEPIILSPAMKNLNWVSTSGLMDQFASAAHQAAVEQSACFVDVHDAWQRIPTVGSNYMVYLNSSINHPNHLGHELFFAGLRRVVEDGK